MVSLQLRLSQHLAMTPQLQQSIRLLQLSSLELNQEIEQALADNPLLEREDEPNAATLRVRADGSIERIEVRVDEARTETAGQSESEVNVEVNGDSLVDWGRRDARADDEDETSPGDWAATAPNLREHLRSQLACTQASPRDRGLVQMLIEALDDDGYLHQSFSDLAALFTESSEIHADELHAALRLLQSFDPPGVGARSAAECLTLQLDAIARSGSRPGLSLAKRIVSEHLPLLAGRDFLKLKRLLGCDDNELRAAHNLIRTLNPFPGVAFGETRADYVVPDVVVRRIGQRWTAVLNADVMPRLRVNQHYADILKKERGRGADPAQRGQWTTRIQEARWLIRNIQQRFETILRVAQAIVDRQHNFFTHGEVAMRPLVLREIADTVSLHESTISRVTANKYMATPLGVYELKYFFGSHVATEAGGAASSTAIRALIKQLIGAENTCNPISDSKLAELLGEQGFVVARRTVAKYREALKIPPVAMRKSL
jgi:RNA polymerase sigma-54 factor